ncbi:MAG: hypothetical protein FJ403_21285 [Verrucomicrobia bacterium]|nr:hypothetical protein [Verrucomicrobiota bacterium]
MAVFAPGRISPRFLCFLKWTRISCLTLCLCAAGSLAYLHWIGLPGFLQNRLCAKLREHGVDLQFSRIRLRGFNNIIAEQLRLRQHSQPDGPRLLIEEGALRVGLTSLTQFHFKQGALTFHGGQLVWPATNANASPRRLLIDALSSELRLQENDRWTLANLSGRFLNANVRVSGVITNASRLREVFSARPRVQRQTNWQSNISALLTKLEQTKFSAPPTLVLHFAGDGKDPNTFRADLSLKAAQTETPWGACQNLSFDLDLSPQPAPAVQPTRADLRVSFDAAQSPIGQLERMAFEGTLLGALRGWQLAEAKWQFSLAAAERNGLKAAPIVASGETTQATNSARGLSTKLKLDIAALGSPWGQSLTNHFECDLHHAMTNFRSFEGKWSLSAEQIESKEGSCGRVTLAGRFAPSNLKAVDGALQADWAFWSKLAGVDLDWTGAVAQLKSPKAEIEKLLCTGQWRAPHVTLRQLRAELYGGHLDSSAELNTQTRELQSEMNFDFDVHGISRVLTPNSQRWLRQFTWAAPPRVRAQARLVLPPWTNAQPNWHKTVLPTVELAGEFEGGEGAFRKVPVTSARSHFTLTNFSWRLPDLIVARPEGKAHLSYAGSMRTQDYYWIIQSQFDPRAIKPLLTADQQRGLDYFKFTAAPLIQGEVWGRWHQPEVLGFVARVAATNFSFRGEACHALSTTVRFTNLFFNFSEISIRQGSQYITAPSVGYDVSTRRLHVTNALSTMDPDVVTKVIGPKVRAALRPYRFAEPPVVVLNGALPTDGKPAADAVFRVAGKSFNYWKFNVPDVSGDIQWRADMVSITNVQANFYGGKLSWQAQFDFTGGTGAAFGFRGSVTNANLHSLMSDLTSISNRLEGIISGNLVITSAHSDDWNSWHGYGDAHFRNGFLWEIPIFGVFSPMLDKIVPGLGNSPVSAGRARFEIGKSVIRTTDLEVRSPALRLQYDGSVDFDGNVNARMQAEILRDAWGVGRIVSRALWPLAKVFEYKITGTLTEPKSEPFYIPKILFWPFKPFRAVKEMLSVEKEDSPNARK